MFEYKIEKITYQSKLNKRFSIEDIELILNNFGNEGWRLFDLQEISINGFLYFEKEISVTKLYTYKILPIELKSNILSQPSIEKNENNINSKAKEGFRLMNLFAHSEAQYYFFEKIIQK